MSKYRHEIKMSINAFDQAILSSRLSSVLKKDKHTGEKGYYTVRSLYFDDISDNALREKMIGIKYREKYRIRTYNDSVSLIRLEKKVKNNGLGFKETALLTKEECQNILQGEYGFLKHRREKVCQQLYLKIRTSCYN